MFLLRDSLTETRRASLWSRPLYTSACLPSAATNGQAAPAEFRSDTSLRLPSVPEDQRALLLLSTTVCLVLLLFRTSAWPRLPEKRELGTNAETKSSANHLKTVPFFQIPHERKLCIKVKSNKTGNRNRKNIQAIYKKITNGDHVGAPLSNTGRDMSLVGM